MVGGEVGDAANFGSDGALRCLAYFGPLHQHPDGVLSPALFNLTACQSTQVSILTRNYMKDYSNQYCRHTDDDHMWRYQALFWTGVILLPGSSVTGNTIGCRVRKNRAGCASCRTLREIWCGHVGRATLSPTSQSDLYMQDVFYTHGI
jgi:hypothetical protein